MKAKDEKTATEICGSQGKGEDTQLTEKSRDKWMRVAEREARKERFHNDMQRIAVKLIQHPEIAEKLSKGEITHTPGVWQAIAGSLRDELDTTAAERDKLREQVKELLAACKELISAYQWDAKTYGFSCKYLAIDKAKTNAASVEAEKQGGKQ